MSKVVFEGRTSLGIELFASLGSGLTQIFWQIVSVRVKTRSYTTLALPVDVREAFQGWGWGWGWDMMFLSRSLLRLPVTLEKVRENVAVTF